MSENLIDVKRISAAAAVTLLLASCTAGPNFVTPPAPQVSGYMPEPIAATTTVSDSVAGGPQRFVTDADVQGQWWTLFHSDALNTLVEHSLQNNPDIGAAQAALLAAHENVLAQRGAYYPAAVASLSASRQKTSDSLSPTPANGTTIFSLYTSQVSVSFVPDVFGLNRRTVESLHAQEEEQRFALAATHIALSANVVVAAIQEAALRSQISATRQLISDDSAVVEVVRAQFANGYVNRLDLAAQESQLAQVAATLPPLVRQLAQQRNLLARLSGAFPDEELVERFDLSQLQLPQELPLTVPSRLVEQRPDVRQAEENLHAASAQIGIAVANRLPSFSLTAGAGSVALALSHLFAAGTGFWGLGAGVTELLDLSLPHRERAARAAYVQAAAQYRAVVLTAFQNVADALQALAHDAEALQAAAAAEQAARMTRDLVRQQMQVGYVGYLAVLSAESTYQQAVINLMQARATRYADTAALFLALGGGWWNRTDLPQDRSSVH